MENVKLDGFGTYFAIFDGHNGTDCATFAAQHLHANILDNFRMAAQKPENRSPAIQAKVKEFEAELDDFNERKAEIAEAMYVLVQQGNNVGNEDRGTLEALVAVSNDIEDAKTLVQQSMDELLAAYTPSPVEPSFQRAMQIAVTTAFQHTDHTYLHKIRRQSKHDGSTGLAVILQGTNPHEAQLLMANAGDCRAVRVEDTSGSKAKDKDAAR